MYWAANNILSWVNFIQSGINLQWIPTLLANSIGLHEYPYQKEAFQKLSNSIGQRNNFHDCDGKMTSKIKYKKVA